MEKDKLLRDIDKQSNFRLEFNRFFALFKKYIKIIIRNKQNLFWIFGYPLLFMALFSIAFQGDNGRSSYTIVLINHDTDGIPEEQYSNSLSCNASMYIELVFDSPSFSKTFKRLEKFDNGTLLNEANAEILLKKEEIDALIILPENFSELVIGSTWWYRGAKNNLDIDSLDYLSDDFKDFIQYANTTTDFPTDSAPNIIIKTTADEVSQMVVENVFQGLVNDLVVNFNNLSRLEIEQYTLVATESVEFNMDTFDYLAPGIVAVGVLVAINNIATMFALDRHGGFMKRLDSTPVPRSIQLLGGGTAQFAFSAIQIIILLACLPLFGVDTAPGADWFLAFIMALSLSFTCIGIGFIIASFAKNPDSAGGISWIFILPLQFLGGGFWYMGGSFVKIIPSYYSINGLRQILVYGLGWSDVYQNIIINLIFGAIFMTIGLVMFSKKHQI
ncbi:MAG: ABC transporter permease [Promethearchaeota archaeon]